eukprot:scaffold4081_cov119-Isochrysis_galbana.AAC.4
MPSRRRGHGGCFGLCGGVHAKQEAWPLVHVEMQLKLSLFFLVRATKGAVPRQQRAFGRIEDLARL